MNKQELIEKLNTVKSVASAFLSVDDVIKMVDELEESNSSFDQQKINDLVADVTNELIDQGMDLIEDYQLEMNYREVEITSVDLNEDRIRKIVSNTIEHYFDSEN